MALFSQPTSVRATRGVSAVVVLIAATVCIPSPGSAQRVAEPASYETTSYDSAPAHISVIEGRATLERDGRIEQSPANVPLVAGDRLRTDDGRVEILFGDGSLLHVDHFTMLDLQSDSLLRLLQGRIRLTVAAGAAVQYRIDAPSASVRIEEPGDYRVSLLMPAPDAVDVELVVLRGAAELANESGATLVRAGERALTMGRGAPSYAQPYNVAYWDAFERWVEDRRQARYGAIAPQYLPPELRYYGDRFDNYGYWNHHVEYGYVWYPRVRAGWRPYHHGRWDYIGPYGWTWIGYDPWAWPTHHFGRWGFSAGAWFWIPRRRWAPAWVSWAVAPGYVGWCPLGFNDRPLININVNLFGRGSWHGWTVVRRGSFAPGIAVSRYALPVTAIGRGAPFVMVRSAPIRPHGVTAAHRTAPIYSVGRSVAVPRDGVQLPAGTPLPPAVRLPSASSSDPALRARPQPSRGVDAGYQRAVPRAGDMGPGGPVPQGPGSLPPSYEPGRARSRSASSEPDTPSYAQPAERARPRDAGVPLPGGVRSMPPTRLPSAPPERGYERRGAPPPGAVPAMPSMPSGPSGPPPDRGHERRRGIGNPGSDDAPRGTPPGPPPRGGDRGGSDRGGDRGGRREPSGPGTSAPPAGYGRPQSGSRPSGGGAAVPRRPGNGA